MGRVSLKWRWLLLAVIAGIAFTVGAIYKEQKRLQAKSAPKAPESLPQNVNAVASDWEWSQNDGDRPVVQVRAKDFRQLQDPPRFQLEHVQLKLYHKDGKVYDDVRSASAYLQLDADVLYSDGAVEINMALPADGSPAGRMMRIRSSGVTFETKTGRAFTEREAQFEFDQGEGKATGASYDPQSRELHMHRNAELWWKGSLPPERHMKVEAGEAYYKEADSVVLLTPWSRLKRGSLTMDAKTSVVNLDNGEIRQVDAQEAKGIERLPNRELEYEAKQLNIHFGHGSVIEKITGGQDVQLVATSPTARTIMRSDRVDMEFTTAKGESLLHRAFAQGNSSVESQPVLRAGVQQTETRVLRSEVIEVKMREGGEEIELVETHTPGEMEFLPNRPGQRHRWMKGERISIRYGKENRIEGFHAVDVSTRTKALAEKGKAPPPDALTWSRLLEARFDPNSGQMSELEQTGEFRYEEGDRKGKAERAKLEQTKNLITLTGGARLWDQTGSTAAAIILLNQANGDMSAEGEVTSTRLPEQKKDLKKAAGSMLDPGEALQARAERMVARDRNQLIRYEGNAKLWQGSNRIEAAMVDIDRKQQTLIAEGGVVSQFVDSAGKADRQKKHGGGGPVFTIVKAPRMTYTDADRLAWYRGGVQLNRPGLAVTSRELHAWLSKEGQDSGTSLERAVAQGSAVIVQSAPDRTRRGSAEQATYELAEEKVVLEGGQPVLVDSLRGTTRGRRLTWFAGSDRLLVDGAAGEPAVSKINRRK